MFMTLGRWLQHQCRRSALSARTQRGGLQLEWLEDRVMPATFNVNTTADVFGGTTASLRNAIQQANTSPDANNTINIVTPGTYAITLTGTPGETDNAAGEFAIIPKSGGSLTINNQSGDAVIIDAQGNSRVFDLNPSNTPLAANATVTFNGGISGITITNGKAAATDDANGSGGNMRDQGSVNLALNNVTVSSGSAGGDGGGIAMKNSVNTPWTLILNNSTVSKNTAGDAGGGIAADGSGTININNSLIQFNTANNQGGGIWLNAIGTDSANLNLTQSVIISNGSGQLGGGVGNGGNGIVTIANSSLGFNGASGTHDGVAAFGGGFADQNNLGTLIVMNSLFQKNEVNGSGGGILGVQLLLGWEMGASAW